MKQFKFVAAALVAIAMLASCQKPDNTGNEPTDTDSSVRIMVSYPASQNTRAAGPALSSSTPIALQPGHIIFTSVTGQIVKHVGIIPGDENTYPTTPDATKPGSQQVTIDNLTKGAGAVITGVPGSAVNCYLVSNDAGALEGGALDLKLEGRDISAVLSRTMAVGTVAQNKMLLYGAGTLSAATGTEDGKEYTKSVVLKVATIASRLQVGKISARDFKPSDTAPAEEIVKITGFKVLGLFVNNAYTTRTVKGEVSNLAFYANGSDYTSSPGGAYASGSKVYSLCDVLSNAVSSGDPLSVALSAAGSVWYYNLLPTETVTDPSLAASRVPHIIVRLTDVKYRIGSGDEQTMSGDRFVTVGSFRYGSGSETGKPVTKFEPNNIYTIHNIAFDYSHIETAPEMKDINALVSVEMMPWVENEIVWGK